MDGRKPRASHPVNVRWLAEVKAWKDKVDKALSRPDRGNWSSAINHDEERAWGQKSFGHFALEVQQSTVNKAMTPGLQKMRESSYVQKAATDMGEIVGSD